MKKLIRGIVEFRKKQLPSYREKFAKLALGQTPDALFIACSDSRVVPNLFASTDPGDLLTVRNVGNLIPPCTQDGTSTGDVSEAAAIEFAVLKLNVTSIVICGHSECGAMIAAYRGRDQVPSVNLKTWLSLVDPALADLKSRPFNPPELAPHNRLSQLNVLAQMKNIKSYPSVQKRLEAGEIAIYGWWFDIAKAEVYAFEEDLQKFVVIDEGQADRMIKKLDSLEA